MNIPVIKLKEGREKSLNKHRPWVFSGAIQPNDEHIDSGATVDVVSANGEWLAKGAFSPTSKIRIRVWTWEPQQVIDRDFFHTKLETSIALRKKLIPEKEDNARRLVHGESDGLPGFIVDQYKDMLVVQVLSAGAEVWKDTVVSQLGVLTGVTDIYERSDVDVRQLEGLEPRKGVLSGSEPVPFVIEENGLKFHVDPVGGQKTGFYLDQRRNRAIVREMMPEGAEVLNCFCYTGGFSIYALSGGAGHVTSIDSSAEALMWAERNQQLNNFDDSKTTWVNGDVFHLLRTFRDSRKTFDVIILDPPKFAPTAAQADQAARGYKDINLLAMKLLRPGGILFTYSCSGGISADLFQKIIAGAALDAGCDMRIVKQLHQDRDHPIAVNFPEGAYLKGLMCVKTS
jgi:23S rRNA (cytosine1962-C5)-methyltransferase